MSHAEYIAKCDEDQLICLVEMANAKLKQIREAGYVKLWVVSDEHLHLAWFQEKDYSLALEYLVRAGAESATKGRPSPLDIRLKKFRPDEAEGLVLDTARECAQAPRTKPNA